MAILAIMAAKLAFKSVVSSIPLVDAGAADFGGAVESELVLICFPRVKLKLDPAGLFPSPRPATGKFGLKDVRGQKQEKDVAIVREML